MCSRPDFEAEEEELNRKLFALMHHWHQYMLMWVD